MAEKILLEKALKQFKFKKVSILFKKYKLLLKVLKQ